MNSKIMTEDKAALDTKFDILGNLPREMCYKILLYLTPQDVANAFACSKKWQERINFNFVWKKIYQRVYSDSEEEPKREVYHKFVQSFSARWQGRYAYNRALKYNVENQNFGEVRIKVNRKTSFRFIHMDDGMIILASEFNFFIINPTTGSVEKKIWFKNLGNFAAIKHGNHLIALTGGGLWKVWNVEDWKVVIDGYLLEIVLSKSGIKVLIGCKFLIIIVTEDGDVFIADIIRKDYVHLGPGTYACSNDNLFAILEDDGDIVIRDTDYNCVTLLNCSEIHRIIHMRMNEDVLAIEYVTRYDYHLLTIFNIKTKESFNIGMWIDVFWRNSNSFQVSKNKLLVRIENAAVRVWDMSLTYLFDIDHEDNDASDDYNIYDIAIYESYVYVKFSFAIGWQIFCLQTGKRIRQLNLPTDDADIMAITNSRLLCKWSYRQDNFWDIIDYEANLLETK